MAKKEERKKKEAEEEISVEEATEEERTTPRLRPKIHTIHTVMSPKRKTKKAPPTGPTQAFQNLRR